MPDRSLTPLFFRYHLPLRGQKSLGPLKMSLEMAHKVIVPQKKIMSRSFLNSGTLIVILAPFSLTQFTHERVLCSFSGFEAEIEKPATWLPGDTLRVLENRILIHNAKPNPEHIIYRYFLVIDWLINLKSIPE